MLICRLNVKFTKDNGFSLIFPFLSSERYLYSILATWRLALSSFHVFTDFTTSRAASDTSVLVGMSTQMSEVQATATNDSELEGDSNVSTAQYPDVAAEASEYWTYRIGQLTLFHFFVGNLWYFLWEKNHQAGFCLCFYFFIIKNGFLCTLVWFFHPLALWTKKWQRKNGLMCF